MYDYDAFEVCRAQNSELHSYACRPSLTSVPVLKAGIELEVMAFLHALTAADVTSCLHQADARSSGM